MKKDAEYFDNSDPQLIYIARKLKDALTLEQVFTDAEVDYGVETDQYASGMVFRTNRTGAFFYVRPEMKEKAVETMLQNGFVPAKDETAD